MWLRCAHLVLACATAAFACAGCSSDDTSVSPAPSSASDAGADATDDQEAPEAQSDGGADGPVDPKYKAIADAMEQERVELGAPGAALAIVRGGEVAFSAGFGSKDPASDDPVHDTTLFRIGSVNKMLTATALLQLADKGDVSLDTPMTTYLPTLSFKLNAAWAPSITVKHLLTHTSAIDDYIEIDSSLRGDDALSAYMLGTFADEQYLMAPAGRFYNYTNPGYMFAGLVTETVAGKPYRINLHDSVLEPLGMSRTVFLPDEVLADGDYALAKSVDWESGEPLVVHPDTYDNGWARPAGYAWSSVLDMAKFIRFLAKGDPAVLSDNLRTEMMSAQVDTQELLDLVWYGYGLERYRGVFVGSSFYEIPVVTHNGAIPGFAADLYYFPTCDLGVVTLGSTDGADFVGTIVAALTTLCELPEPATPPDLTVDPATFDSYVGDYQDDFNVGPVTLTRVNDELHISMPLVDQANVPYDDVLTPVSPASFIINVQGTQLLLTMIVDAEGKGEYMRTRPFVAVRAATPPPPAQVHPVTRTELLRRLRQAPAARADRSLLIPGNGLSY